MNKINTTRFMTQEELMEQLTEIDMENPVECTSAGVPLLVKNQRAYVDTSDSHTIIFGATGSKKTRLFGMPSVELLSRAGESFVVTDPKGEIYEKTIGNVTERGYQVYCLNLREFKSGVAWNPLTLPYDCYQRGEKSKAIELVNEIAKQMMGDELADPYWNSTGADVVAGLMMILLECAERESCNIKSLFALWEQYLDDREEMLEMIKKRFGKSVILRKLRSLDNASERTVGSIEAIVATGFNKLNANEEFVEFLSQEGMEFDAVSKGKVAIYLIIPDENHFYHFVASLFMEQLYEVLIKEAQKQPRLKLETRMNYIIDEFANIPKMENMAAMITAARSRNIRFNLIVQSKMQLDEKYGEAASIISDNCNNWIYLYSKDYELLNEISRLCGTVLYDNHMSIPLISEFELQHLRKEEGEALVLAGRNYPCIANLADIDAYSGLREKEDYLKNIPTQEWKPVRVFELTKERNQNTFKYVPTRREKEWEDMMESCTKTMWLVGTCNGMILVEDLVTAPMAISGEGILRLGLAEFDNLSEVVGLTWYSATRNVRDKYVEKLYKNQELAFLTLNEVGRAFFKPIPEQILEMLKGAVLS